MTSKNKRNITQSDLWPSLPYEEWQDTLETLHMWMQIIGKVKLTLCPFVNQWWEVALYVTPTGMTTGRIPYENMAFEIHFNFIAQKLTISTSSGHQKIISLKPCSVAEFYKDFMSALHSLGIKVSINTTPSEVSNPIDFIKDTEHASYDIPYAEKWWRIQLQSSLVFDRFRSNFRGKSSPIQFFWGSFDLSGTRFSGNKALPPKLKGALGKIMHFAENEENFAFGFWPGDARFPEPAFYTYLYPAPKGCETIKTGPSIAYYNNNLSECILPYEDVRKTKKPEETIMDFLITTYKEYSKLAKWQVKTLEGPQPF